MDILLAADGSEYTKRAARYVAEHAGTLAKKPTIHVLTVHAPLPYGRAAAVLGRKTVEKYQREECEHALAVATKELDKAGLKYRSGWVVGEVAQEIARYAKKQGIELIVMGSRGHGAIAGLAMGSVTAKVLATTRTPVLIVR